MDLKTDSGSKYNTMGQEQPKARSRLKKAKKPRKQIGLRITQDEYAELDLLAEKDGRTASNLANWCYQRGLEAYKREKQQGGGS